MISAFLIAVAIFLPSRYVGVGLPALWVVQSLGLHPDIVMFSAGPVDLAPMDFVLSILAIKLSFTLAFRNKPVADKRLYAAMALYVGVNLFATIIAGAKFGDGQLLRCVTALVRFLTDLTIVPVVAQAVRTVRQAKHGILIVIATLAVLALIQFVNFVGASHGVTIGEVQGLEREETRYFGPLGDTIGVILLLGYITSLCFRSVVGIGAFLGGILLTAGLGAVLAAGVSTVIFLILGTRRGGIGAFPPLKVRLLPILVLVIAGIVVVSATPLAGTLMDRLTKGETGGSGSQRVASATLALEIITNNPLLGVGYLGYQAVLHKYGGDKFFDLTKPDGSTANANNQILQSLTDSGVVGLFAFGVLIFYAARLLYTVAARSEDPFFSTFFFAGFIWLLSQLVGNLAAAWLVPGSFVARFLWILLGLALAVERLLPELGRRNVELAPSRPHQPRMALS